MLVPLWLGVLKCCIAFELPAALVFSDNDELFDEDHLEDEVCTVWALTTCSDPEDVRACKTSNCFLCECCIPFGVETFCESTTWN